jgi:CBS domain containing-hemolysin-like protein
MIYLFLLVFFIISQGFFSGIETGLVSLLKPKIKYGIAQKEWGAKTLMFFVERPGILLATTLLGSNICVVCSANMAKNALAGFGLQGDRVNIILTFVMALILMNVEIIPKDWFRQSPYQRCRRFAWLFKGAYYLLIIPSHILSFYARIVNNLISRKKDEKQDTRIIMRKDFQILLGESRIVGTMNTNIAAVMDNAIYYHRLKVANLMIRRAKTLDVSANMTMKEAFEFCQSKNISRAPVKISEDNTNKWIGVFSIYDLIFNIDETQWDKIKVGEYMRPIPEISANEAADNIFNADKNEGSPILAVADPANPKNHLGIINLFTVAERLLGF